MIVRLQYNIEITLVSVLPVCDQAYNWKNIFIERVGDGSFADQCIFMKVEVSYTWKLSSAQCSRGHQ